MFYEIWDYKDDGSLERDHILINLSHVATIKEGNEYKMRVPSTGAVITYYHLSVVFDANNSWNLCYLSKEKRQEAYQNLIKALRNANEFLGSSTDWEVEEIPEEEPLKIDEDWTTEYLK